MVCGFPPKLEDKKMTREEFETKWQSLTPRERDAWVAEEVMGDKPKEFQDYKHGEWIYPAPYSKNMSATMEVVKKMKEQIYSKRRKFLNCLQESTRIDEKSVVAWPDVFWFITPEAICKAALICKVVE